MGDAGVISWLKSDRKKPLLVHGPLQSGWLITQKKTHMRAHYFQNKKKGKKTLIRSILKKMNYFVIEPSVSVDKEWTVVSLDVHRDSGLYGKHAFIMRVEEVGLKPLPNVEKAPVVYVCHDPYDLGLTKAELSGKFHVIQLNTGRDYSDRRWNGFKDVKLNYWDTLNKVRANISLMQKMYYTEKIGDYLPVVINNSYLHNGCSLKSMVESSDMFSQVIINKKSNSMTEYFCRLMCMMDCILT
jgi:hypothetical protein